MDVDKEALHTGTETGFTGSGFNVGMQTMRIALLDWISCTVPGALSCSTLCSSDPDRGHVEARSLWMDS